MLQPSSDKFSHLQAIFGSRWATLPHVWPSTWPTSIIHKLYEALLSTLTLAFEHTSWNYAAKFCHLKAILMICWPISNWCRFQLRAFIGHPAPALNQPKAEDANMLKLCSAILICVGLITFEKLFVQQIKAALKFCACHFWNLFKFDLGSIRAWTAHVEW